MLVRMKQLICGSLGVWEAGQEYDIPKSAGEALVQGGYAEAITPALDNPLANVSPPLKTEEPREIETAMVEPPERAILPKAKPRKPVPKPGKPAPRKR